MSKRIILLSNAYWPSIGGIENSLRHLAQESVKAGDKVKIIVSDIGVENTCLNYKEEIVDGISVTRYPFKPIKSKLLSPFNLFATYFLLYRLLRRERIDHPETVIIARFHFSALVAVWAKFKNIRYLVPSVNSNQSGQEKDSLASVMLKLRLTLHVALHNIVQRAALRKTEAFVFSETMKSQCASLANNGLEAYRLTKPGVDVCRFNVADFVERQLLKNKLKLPINKPLILFVGRFVKAKGVDLLIDALPIVDPSSHLVLIGAGKEGDNYKKKINDLDLINRITMIPPLRQVEDYYRCADIFVMCSSYEPLGQTILEAFSSGLPVVAFKKSDSVNTATQELGMDKYTEYAKEHTASALAQAINNQIKSLKNNEVYDRQLVSGSAKEKFSWMKLYDELVDS